MRSSPALSASTCAIARKRHTYLRRGVTKDSKRGCTYCKSRKHDIRSPPMRPPPFKICLWQAMSCSRQMLEFWNSFSSACRRLNNRSYCSENA